MREGNIDTNGVRLWFRERGDPAGPAVLFVNGAMSTSGSWPDELLDPLARAGCRVVVFDNRDVGRSTHIDRAAHPYGIGDLASDTIGLMDGLGIERAHVVGQSMGGIIGQLLAIHQPERVASLTLLNSTPGPDDRLSGPVGTEWGTNPSSSHGDPPTSVPSRIDDLADITARTLIVHGDEDPLFPLDHATVMAAAIPGSTLVVWDGVGHELPTPRAPELARLVLGLVEI